MQMSSNRRRGVLFGAMVVGTLLALSSAALGCTGMRGKFTVKMGTASDPLTNYAIGFGADTGQAGINQMQYCNGNVAPSGATVGGTGIDLTGPPANSSSVISVKVEPYDCIAGGANSQLNPGEYTVGWFNYDYKDVHRVDPRIPVIFSHCMNLGSVGATQPNWQGPGLSFILGAITIDLNGYSLGENSLSPGFRTYTFPARDPLQPGDGEVCISDGTASFGNIVPASFY